VKDFLITGLHKRFLMVLNRSSDSCHRPLENRESGREDPSNFGNPELAKEIGQNAGWFITENANIKKSVAGFVRIVRNALEESDRRDG
jgi:hypothetical protein